MINIGAYVEGSNPEIDYAIKKLPEINAFLRQGIGEKVNYAECLTRIKRSFPVGRSWILSLNYRDC